MRLQATQDTSSSALSQVGQSVKSVSASQSTFDGVKPVPTKAKAYLSRNIEQSFVRWQSILLKVATQSDSLNSLGTLISNS